MKKVWSSSRPPVWGYLRVKEKAQVTYNEHDGLHLHVHMTTYNNLVPTTVGPLLPL